MVTSSSSANAAGKGHASTQQGQRSFFHPAKEVLKGDVLVQKGEKQGKVLLKPQDNTISKAKGYTPTINQFRLQIRGPTIRKMWFPRNLLFNILPYYSQVF